MGHDWIAAGSRAEERYADGERRLPDGGDERQRQLTRLGNAAGAARRVADQVHLDAVATVGGRVDEVSGSLQVRPGDLMDRHIVVDQEDRLHSLVAKPCRAARRDAICRQSGEG